MSEGHNLGSSAGVQLQVDATTIHPFRFQLTPSLKVSLARVLLASLAPQHHCGHRCIHLNLQPFFAVAFMLS